MPDSLLSLFTDYSLSILNQDAGSVLFKGEVMKTKFALCAVAALSAIAIVSPAAAATVVVNAPGSFTVDKYHGNGSFTDTFSITLSNSVVGGSVLELGFGINNFARDIDFTSISFGGKSFTKTVSDTLFVGETWALTPSQAFAAGTYDLVISGRSYAILADAGYRATLTVGTPAVPEPATWAMMTLGFGAVGFAMRRKKVSTRIRFA